ncbi:hypothetical protein B4914_14165 [Yersinia entomophaga]|nr:hypothetical protein B4914_14165 [Yersinia entomophaga]
MCFIRCPLIAHGASNLSENAHYLLFREEPEASFLRYAYQHTAIVLGGTNQQGDIAYFAHLSDPKCLPSPALSHRYYCSVCPLVSGLLTEFTQPKRDDGRAGYCR